MKLKTFFTSTLLFFSLVAGISLRSSHVQASQACSSDLNDDGIINLLDYSTFVQLYQTQNNLLIDLNNDLVVNLLDYSTFVQVYLAGCPAASPTPTPTPDPTPSPTPTPTPISSTIWDNGLSKRCVITALTPTAQAGGQPLYQDLSQCLLDDPIFSQSRWQLGFQAESGYGATGNCEGFPAINTTNSPLTFNWLDQNDGTLTGHLTLDLLSKPHPCPGAHFNWFIFMNQATATATLPRIDRLQTSHTVFYKKITQNGASRLIASVGGFIKTSEASNPEMFSIEVALDLDGWGDNFPSDPIISKCDQATCGSTHVFIDGSQFNLHVTAEQEQTVTIPWNTIYSYLVSHNHLPAPYEYSNAYLSTGNVGLGFEVNNFSQNDSYFAELFQADFAIIEL